MYIKRLTIYGFGQWVDQSFSFNQQMTCFYGKNESGKSTLQNFILFMLFGLPPRERKFHMPKTSGKLGGRLTIVDEKVGEYTIERVEGQQNAKATCYLAKGEVKDEQWLKQQLKGFNLAMYESVYSFSATDLLGLENMEAKDIGDIILSIGLTGSKHIYKLEKNLSQQLGQLFKPYGKNPTINKYLTDLESLQKQLAEQEKMLATYKSNRANIERLSTEINTLLQKRSHLQKKITHLTKLLQAISLIQDYKYNKEQLNQLPAQLKFPEKGVERFTALKEQLLPLESELTLLNEQIKQSKEIIEKASKQCVVDELLQQAKQLTKQQSVYDEREQLISHEAKQLVQDYDILEKQLAKLNIQLTLTDLGDLNFPFQTQSYWQSLNNEHEQIKLAAEHHAEQKRENDLRTQSLKERLQAINAKLLTPAKRQEIVEQLNNVQQEPTHHNQQATIKKHLQREQRQRYVLFGSSLLLAVIMFFVGYLTDYKLLMLVALFPFVFGTIAAFVLKNSTDTMKQLLIENEQRTLPYHLDHYNELIARLEKDDALKYEQKSIKDELKTIHIKRLQFDEKLRAINERRKRLNDQLQNVKEQYPFLKDVQLPFWADLYHQLNQIIDQYKHIEERKKQHGRLKKEQETFAQRVRELSEQIFPQLLEQTVVVQMDAINQFIDDQTNLNQQLLYEKANVKELIDKKQRLAVQVKSLQKDVKDLLNKANVQTEESFYELAALIEAKQTYEKSVEKLDNQLSLIFQTKDWEPLINRPLEEQLLTEEISELQKMMATYDETLEEKRQALANVKAKNNQLEQSDDYSTLMHEINRTRNEFNRLAKQWAVIKTAEQMLQRSMQTYQQKHLQDVLQQTTIYFQRMTKGAYTKVFLQPEEKALTVQAANQLHFKVAHLSKGTIDQLYIALRLAVSRIVGQKYRLPFIIDDAFIHSDHERAAKIVHILQEIAAEQQLILFTCHEHIVTHFPDDQIKQLEPQISVK